jgi:hypothetical protein
VEPSLSLLRKSNYGYLFQEELQEPRGPGAEVQVLGRGWGREDHTGGAEGESDQTAAKLYNVSIVECRVR